MHQFFGEYRRRLSEFIRSSCASAHDRASLNSEPLRDPLDVVTPAALEASPATVPDEAIFNQLALSLFAWQFDHVPVYRQFCTLRRSTPNSVRTWRDIPPLTVTAFKEFEITSIAPEQRTAFFYSSGTTGASRSRHFHNRESLSLYEASLLPWFLRHVVPETSINPSFVPSLNFLFLTPPPVAAPHSSLVHMFGHVATTFAPDRSAFLASAQSDSWTADVHQATELLNAAVTNSSPVILLGTAFSFIELLDALALQRREFTLPHGSRVMETGGYKGRSRAVSKTELHRVIERQLGIQPHNIISEYGMSELSSQAYDQTVIPVLVSAAGDLSADPKKIETVRRFQFPPWVRVQIISPETGRVATPGETGLIRVFDLANIASVMAIQTEDLAVAFESGFELAGRTAAAEARGCSLMAAA